MCLLLPSTTKLRQGNMFTPVCQSFCSHGGGCLPQCMLEHTPYEVHPLAGTPPCRYIPCGQIHPLWAGTPPGRYIPWAGTPPGRYIPWAGTPQWAGTPPLTGTPPGRNTTLVGKPPWAGTPPGRYTPPMTVTAVDGTHSTGMLSLFVKVTTENIHVGQSVVCSCLGLRLKHSLLRTTGQVRLIRTVNSKFHLIRSFCEIFSYHFLIISCLKFMVNSNLIRRNSLPTNDFKLTVPNLYGSMGL